jgi:alpha-tubulin suppressor-like RCC1 family protein
MEWAQPYQSGQYRLSISNSAGMAVSAPANVTVHEVPGLFLWNDWSTSFLPDMNHVSSVSGGSMHFLALRDDGTVIAWGEDRYGVLEFPTVPGWYDTLEWSNRLSDPLWIMGIPRSGDGTLCRWTVELPDVPISEIFYRVRRWQP